MVDPLLLGAVGIATLTLPEQVKRILGPTSDYLGEKLRDLIALRQKNLEEIVIKTGEVLGDGVEEEGIINPRIVERLINSGSYIEDDLVQRYFAGVMAASRTTTGTDDRGLYLLDLIIKMSNVDLKAHYILYSKMREKHLGTSHSIFKVEDRHRLFCRIPVNEFFLEFRKYYKDTYEEIDILTEFVPRLLKEELLNDCIFGPRSFCSERQRALFVRKKEGARARPRFSVVDASIGVAPRSSEDQLILSAYSSASTAREDAVDEDSYIVCTPSPLGAQLYLWVHGEGHRLANEIFKPSLKLKEISFSS
ncbi:hypothetical protein J2741_000256 [Methanolinea mesophila]|uniref:hypothetical protein n=1 Tax=Methanolinea mesophila TaxID=547055 RepID=UPI001AE677F2|nr:hypothetical protein [Methanolinea mesophila]MBP1927709.1 hypothetical protein [Methanolinea mesophila]